MGEQNGGGPRLLAVAAFYDHLAAIYDRDYAHPPGYTGRQARWLARACRSGPLLDLGCGTGRLLGPLAHLGLRPAVGLDCSAGMLARARLADPLANLVLAQAGRPLPFATDSFQSIISLHASLIHITEPDALAGLAAECLRVLRPGGVLVVELPHPCSYPPDPSPGRWRAYEPGLSVRRVAPEIEELRVDDQGGIRTRVRRWEADEVAGWLEGFARLELHPGFAGGRFDTRRGRLMVVLARKA